MTNKDEEKLRAAEMKLLAEVLRPKINEVFREMLEFVELDNNRIQLPEVHSTKYRIKLTEWCWENNIKMSTSIEPNNKVIFIFDNEKGLSDFKTHCKTEVMVIA